MITTPDTQNKTNLSQQTVCESYGVLVAAIVFETTYGQMLSKARLNGWFDGGHEIHTTVAELVRRGVLNA